MCCAVRTVVNAGLTLNFTDEKEKDPATGKPWKESWCYQNGIARLCAGGGRRGHPDPGVQLRKRGLRP